MFVIKWDRWSCVLFAGVKWVDSLFISDNRFITRPLLAVQPLVTRMTNLVACCVSTLFSCALGSIPVQVSWIFGMFM